MPVACLHQGGANTRLLTKSIRSFARLGLAPARGIDPHAVTRWINAGHRRPVLVEPRRGNWQNGDIYLIRERDVRRFVLEHPSDIDLRKLDQLWFRDIITNGLV